MKIIKKRCLPMLLACMLILSSLPLTANAAQNTWDPANGHYDISTEADLLAFRDTLNNEEQYDGVTVNLLQNITMTQDYV